MTISAGSIAVAAPSPGCPDGWVPSPGPGKCQPENLTGKRPGIGKRILKRRRPDLKIRSYRFSRIAKKRVRVRIANVGRRAARPSVLMLTVRKINGTKVARRVRVRVPMIRAGKSVVVMVNAKSILPKSVALKKTTFRLKADSTNRVRERNERNNTAMHRF
ncbi:CARDB domain-containing protein [Romeriopsis navalis]|nr:CARDB domain-containing protein [Romeriopsis navalis]